MKANRHRVAIGVSTVFVMALGCVILDISARGTDEKDAGAQAASDRRAGIQESPIVIWFHSGISNSVESLDLALSSGLVTHVLLLYMHRADADWKTNADVLRAIAMVKQSKAKLIWSRALWPYYANEGIGLDVLFDPKYYVREIQALRAEAKEIGADLVALDTEPYGQSPMRHYLKGDYQFDARQFALLKSAVKEVVAVAGRVDYVLPAGRPREVHPYEILALLGRMRITETTYYAKERVIKSIRHPYEVFGVHLNTVRHRARNPRAPYFLVRDIFERPELWSDKNQLFLYSSGRDCLAVARDLAAYAKTLPAQDSAEEKKRHVP